MLQYISVVVHGFYINWYIFSLWKLHLEITIVTTSYNFFYTSLTR